MKHSDSVIGGSFWCGQREWRCTDIGTRTIIAICLDVTDVEASFRDPAVPDTTRTLTQAEAKAEGWFNGPPYAVADSVFDEHDQISVCVCCRRSPSDIDRSLWFRMNSVNQFEDSASRSRGKHEGESSNALCDRLSRTRDTSPRQLPTDHDHAVPTREYQTD